MKHLLLIALLLVSFSGYAFNVHAGDVFSDALKDAQTTAGASSNLSDKTLTATIGSIVDGTLGVLGIIAVILFVYAGIQYMTSAGKPEAVEKAKKRMYYAVIGLFIILIAYSITTYVVSSLAKVT